MSIRRTIAATAATAAAAVVLAQPGTAHASEMKICGVFSDGLLRCQNAAPTSVRSAPYITDSWQVDTLRTTYSWFICWRSGELHSGGNHTWYKTVGDDHGATGWVPASAVYTSSAFDLNPGYHGLRPC